MVRDKINFKKKFYIYWVLRFKNFKCFKKVLFLGINKYFNFGL